MLLHVPILLRPFSWDYQMLISISICYGGTNHRYIKWTKVNDIFNP